ncbi:MAG: hypothetical protein KF874_07025 [Rhizobiaceae bacterium]|nr:hypothetical protein [Rhizobiaceae bacterium]
MSAAPLGPIEIFRAGTFTPMSGKTATITENDLRRIAETYDPVNSPAPVVIGHPETDAPAYAWVDRLYVEGGKLKATVKETVAQFADFVKQGLYKRVSISLFLPDSSANPKPGEFYLKHVGFLGAAAPAVPGLKPVQFSNGANDCIEFAHDIRGIGAFASTDDELKALRKQVAEQEMERFITEGRLLPAFKAEAIDFAASLDASETISFADGENTTRREWFMSFLSRQPKVISFGRHDLGNGPLGEGSHPLTVPDGFTVDPRQSELYARARQIEREKGISFADAVELATGR